MRATVAADLSTSRLDTIVVDTVSVRASVADGMAAIQKLYALGSHTAATATGTFGLIAGRTGTLNYHVDVDSLGALNRWIPRTAGDTAPIRTASGCCRAGAYAAQRPTRRASRARRKWSV